MKLLYSRLPVVLILLATSGFADQSSTSTITTMRTTSDHVQWTPNIDQELSLRVSSPDGTVITRTFEPGQPPVFDATDLEETRLPDGLYTFEIKVIPDQTRSRGSDGDAISEKNEPRHEMQSGYFTVVNGSILSAERIETNLEQNSIVGGDVTTMAAPINGDLTVRNHLCVGVHCDDTETFELDDIVKLKGTGLQIYFDDTSTSSFPDTDWRITSNDGAEKFSIEDSTGDRVPFTIEAGASQHSLYVDSAGRVGIGTSAPVVETHLVDGDTPALRLEQDASSGFAPQTWDVVGNETNFFVRDATNGSTLPFRIFPGSPSSSLVIREGDVGVGTSSPNGRFHIVGPDDPRIRLEDNLDNANDKPGLAMKSPASDGGGEWRFETDNAGNFQIDYSLSAGPEIVIIDDPLKNGRVKINGDLVVQGTCTGCDGIFQSGYELESIEEHASFMWENSHLPAVGPTPDGKTSLMVFQKTVGILKELEKAHIYIEQLHERIEELSGQVARNTDFRRKAKSPRQQEFSTVRFQELETENSVLRDQLQQLMIRLTALESVLATTSVEQRAAGN